MSPEMLFFITLVIKMTIAALFVIAATVTAERAGAVVGALVATLPISAGPAYVFLSLDHPSEFIASSALTSLVANVATGACAFTFMLLAQRAHLVLSLVAGVAVWFVLAHGLNELHWTPLGAALLNAIAFPMYHWIGRTFREVRMPRLPLRPADFVMRGLVVALLVAALVTLSFRIGPRGSGELAVFPAMYTSIMIVLYRRVGPRAAAAVVANGFLGLAGFGAAMLTLQTTVIPLGIPAALTLALAVSIAWNLSLYVLHRQRTTAKRAI